VSRGSSRRIISSGQHSVRRFMTNARYEQRFFRASL
jgi:hypothetical protein